MKYVFLVTALLLGTAASAQKPGGWTLEMCMRYAVENSPQMGAQAARNGISRQDYKQAVARLLPSLSVGADAGFSFGRSLDAETNIYNDVNSFSNSYVVSSSMVLFAGFSGINEARMQRINMLAGKKRLEMKRDKLAYSAMEAFFNVQYSGELVCLAESRLSESRRELERTRRMAELGVKGFPDVAEMQAREAADSYNLTRQTNVLRICVIKLKETMNFPVDSLLEIEPYRPEGDTIAPTDNPAYGIYVRSLSFLPEARVAESAVQARQMSYKAAKGRLFPTLSVSGSFSTGFSRYMDGTPYLPFGEQISNKRGYYVGFSLSLPVLNAFSRTGAVRKNKLELMIARSEREEALRTLYSEIEQAVTDMNGLAAEYLQAERQTEAMDVAHRVNLKKYEQGLVGALDLNVTANRLLEARIGQANARLRFYMKKKLVEYYSGQPFLPGYASGDNE